MDTADTYFIKSPLQKVLSSTQLKRIYFMLLKQYYNTGALTHKCICSTFIYVFIVEVTSLSHSTVSSAVGLALNLILF